MNPACGEPRSSSSSSSSSTNSVTSPETAHGPSVAAPKAVHAVPPGSGADGCGGGEARGAGKASAVRGWSKHTPVKICRATGRVRISGKEVLVGEAAGMGPIPEEGGLEEGDALLVGWLVHTKTHTQPTTQRARARRGPRATRSRRCPSACLR